LKPVAFLLVLAVGASAWGCGEKKTGGTSGSGASQASGAPEGSGPRVMKFRIGRSAASDGIVTIETDSFGQGDPVYVSFEIKNLPAKSQAKVVWSDSSKMKISEEQKQPASGSNAVSFQMKAAADLAMGDYIVDLFCGDPGSSAKWTWLGSKSFKVGAKRPG